MAAKWLHQLLGCCLLDYDNQYEISSVGVMLPRQGTIIQWQLEEVMRTLSRGQAHSISEERSAFKAAMKPLALQNAELRQQIAERYR